VNFSKQGNGLLFASHVLHEIEEITSSFLLIHGGRLLASGTARDVEQIIADTPQEVVLFGPDVPRLIPHLADQSWVDSIQLLSERTELRIGLRDPTNLYQSLAGWISADHLQVDRFQTADSNLTAVFESLLRRHRGESK
jgi:ABC-2 type transport system ATP-binding protein